MMRAILVVVALALGGLLGAHLLDSHTPPPSAQTRVSPPDDSDYYLLDAVVQQMDDNGQREYRMTTARALHFPDQSTQLTDIHVNYLGQAQSLWQLDAAQGRIPAGRRDILLHDGVEVTRNQAGEQNMQLRTEHAWVRPDLDQVDTDVAVHASAPGQQTNAVGMTIFIKQNRVVLAKNVQVTYRP